MFGGLERPHDSRFAVENFVDLQDIPDAFVHFG
jgi:hypothetical protein